MRVRLENRLGKRHEKGFPRRSQISRGTKQIPIILSLSTLGGYSPIDKLRVGLERFQRLPSLFHCNNGTNWIKGSHPSHQPLGAVRLGARCLLFSIYRAKCSNL